MSSNIKIGRWYFIPSLKLSIISIVLFSILVYLGTWQVGRAKYKIKISTQLQQKSTGEPVSLKSLNINDSTNNRFIPVFLDGVFLNNFTFLLDNQMYQHKPGYRILTAVQAPSLEKLVLIDRGWVALGSSRQTLPVIEEIYGLKRIVGIINTIPNGIILQKDTFKPTDAWPVVIQQLDYEFISKALQHEVYSFVVQLQTHDLTTYDIIPIEFGISSTKNIGYALQWYFFAALVVIYYLIASFKKDA
jgi:surfeit locus 1 family protein